MAKNFRGQLYQDYLELDPPTTPGLCFDRPNNELYPTYQAHSRTPMASAQRLLFWGTAKEYNRYRNLGRSITDYPGWASPEDQAVRVWEKIWEKTSEDEPDFDNPANEKYRVLVYSAIRMDLFFSAELLCYIASFLDSSSAYSALSRTCYKFYNVCRTPWVKFSIFLGKNGQACKAVAMYRRHEQTLYGVIDDKKAELVECRKASIAADRAADTAEKQLLVCRKHNARLSDRKKQLMIELNMTMELLARGCGWNKRSRVDEMCKHCSADTFIDETGLCEVEWCCNFFGRVTIVTDDTSTPSRKKIKK